MIYSYFLYDNLLAIEHISTKMKDQGSTIVFTMIFIFIDIT